MAVVQLIFKKEGQSTPDLVKGIEDVIKSYNGVGVKSNTQIENWYEISEHGVVIGQFAPDGRPRIQNRFVNSNKFVQFAESDGVLFYLGFRENDEVYTNLKKDLSRF